MDKEFPDYLASVEDSERLADQIRKYWNIRGYYPDVWVDKGSLPVAERKKMGPGMICIIRSDMVNGQPQKRIH